MTTWLELKEVGVVDVDDDVEELGDINEFVGEDWSGWLLTIACVKLHKLLMLNDEVWVVGGDEEEEEEEAAAVAANADWKWGNDDDKK